MALVRFELPCSDPSISKALTLLSKPVASSKRRQSQLVSLLSVFSLLRHGKRTAVNVEEKWEVQDENFAGICSTSQRLRQSTAVTYIVLIWDVVLTFLPVVSMGRSRCSLASTRVSRTTFLLTFTQSSPHALVLWTDGHCRTLGTISWGGSYLWADHIPCYLCFHNGSTLEGQ